MGLRGHTHSRPGDKSRIHKTISRELIMPRECCSFDSCVNNLTECFSALWSVARDLQGWPGRRRAPQHRERPRTGLVGLCAPKGEHQASY